MNQQLSEKEEHDIQKHLIDCDFCSEALEGMKYATNSSVLFTIDHKIDGIVSKKKTPILKNLMLAASVLVVLFGAYFSYLTFNNVITENESNISLNTTSPKTDNEVLEEIIPAFEESAEQEEETGNLQQNTNVAEQTERDQIETIVASKENQKVKALEVDATILKNVMEEAEPMSFAANAEVIDLEDDVELLENEISDKKAEEVVTLSATGSTSTRADNMPLKLDKSYKSSGNKRRAKEKTSAPAPIETEKELLEENRNESFAGGYFDEKNKDDADTEVTKDVISQAVTSADVAADEFKENIEGDVLEKGIALYQQKKYEEAIKHFNIELLTKTTRNKSKTHWYKALCLIELNKIEEAKTNLTQVINYNDEFLNEAKNKLAELE
jgi:tetratricopeptide (TPR) repeat protein